MSKKIALLVRDRQKDALRMGVGIILLDDQVDVYLLDHKVEETDENTLNLETMKELEMNIYTNTPENEGYEQLETEVIGKKLLDYDHIIAY